VVHQNGRQHCNKSLNFTPLQLLFALTHPRRGHAHPAEDDLAYPRLRRAFRIPQLVVVLVVDRSAVLQLLRPHQRDVDAVGGGDRD
jgi:hypothetical protein